MAKILSLITFLLLIVLFTAATAKHHEDGKPKEIKITVYFQLFTSGRNKCCFAVAGIPGRPRNFHTFGTVFVEDFPITQGISLNSPEIARGQGIQVIASLDGANAYSPKSIIFTSGKYNGSTLEVQGISARQFSSTNVRELAIVSGTGRFRFTQGYGLFKTVVFRPSQNYYVVRAVITALDAW